MPRPGRANCQRRPHHGVRASLAVVVASAVLAGCGAGNGLPGLVGSDPANGGTTPPEDTTNPTPVPLPPAQPGGPGSGLGQAPAPGTAPASYTISGQISLAETNEIDADTNDPVQPNRRSNNSLAGAQDVTNPVLLIGYLNVPGEGPEGPSRAPGDLVDVFKTSLRAGQTVELDFAADPGAIDVDLGIFDTAGEVVGASVGLNSYECVQISADGDYFIVSRLYTQNNASSGGTVYQMRINQPDSGVTCPNLTETDAGVIAGEVIAQRADPASLSAKQAFSPLARPVILKGEAGTDRAALLEVPRDVAAAFEQAGGSRTTKAGNAGDNAWHLPALSAATRHVIDTIDYAKGLESSGIYRYATPNTRVSAYQVQAYPPNDRDYAKQRWHYDSIDLTNAIALLASQNPQSDYVPIVAVIDTGIVADHPDLTNQLVPGYDFVASSSSSGDGNGIDANPNDEDTASTAVFHGSHVAGTIAAQAWNGTGGASVAPMARIMPIRALSNGSGSSYDVLQGVLFAAGLPNDSGGVPQRKADVINLSLGGNRPCSPDQQEVFSQARAAGVISVLASGNESTASRLTPVGAPANCQGVISVGATDALQNRARYSNGGENLTLVAPGGDVRQNVSGAPDGIYSTSASVNNGRRTPTYTAINGTSMAAPHAAGIIALMRYVAPGITPAQVDTLISSGQIVDDLGNPGRDVQYGFGQLNARKAVQAALDIGGGPLPPPPAVAVEARPASLSLGSTRETLEFELRASGTTGERVVSVVSDSPAVVVAAKPGAVGEAGLGTYTVTANRAVIEEGRSVFAKILVTLAPARSFEVPVTVERRNPSAAGGNLGPVYVLVADADDPELRGVAQAVVAQPVNGVYAYTVTVPGASRILVVAGTDTDNDGAICNRGEGCGAFPVLGTQIQTLEPRGNLTGIDFSMAPFGGINPTVNGAAQWLDAQTLDMLPDPAALRTGLPRLR